jgi:hypothetical protein
MDEEVLVTIKFKVKKSNVDDFKMEFQDTIDDFIDTTIATQDGEMEVTEIKE